MARSGGEPDGDRLLSYDRWVVPWMSPSEQPFDRSSRAADLDHSRVLLDRIADQRAPPFLRRGHDGGHRATPSLPPWARPSFGLEISAELLVHTSASGRYRRSRCAGYGTGTSGRVNRRPVPR